MKADDEAYWEAILADLPVGQATPCSYFADRKSNMQYFVCDEEIPAILLEKSLALGYRRCGETYYRTHCKNCNLCLTYRLPVKEFNASRNQRRVWKRNQDLEIKIVKPQISDEKKEIYLRYQYHQHHLKPVKGIDKKFSEEQQLDIMQWQMYDNPDSSRELEMYLDDQLIGFGIIDRAIESISLVYFVFDIDYARRSLGTMNILYSIDWAEKNDYDYVYLGYYIPRHPKMDYKQRFQPAQLKSQDGVWQSEMPELIGMPDNIDELIIDEEIKLSKPEESL